jgi:excisionase family DNA binding protein
MWWKYIQTKKERVMDGNSNTSEPHIQRVHKTKRPTGEESTSEPKCRELTQTYLSPGSDQRKAIKKLAYSKREAAEATSLSVRTLDYMIQRGQLKAVKAPGTTRVLIPARQLEVLVNGGVLNGSN